MFGFCLWGFFVFVDCFCFEMVWTSKRIGYSGCFCPHTILRLSILTWITWCPRHMSNTQGHRWRQPRLFSMFLFAFSIFVCCRCCCWQIRYQTASMPPEAYWHSGAVHRFSNRLELFQFCYWQIWTDMLLPLFPGCNNSERLIYKTCSTINSWIDFLLGISGAAVF